MKIDVQMDTRTDRTLMKTIPPSGNKNLDINIFFSTYRSDTFLNFLESLVISVYFVQLLLSLAEKKNCENSSQFDAAISKS